MAAKGLRVVAPGEKPQASKGQPAKTVTAAANDGDRLELLIAMRTRIAKAVEDADTPARDLAALTRRLLEIAKDIDVLQAAKVQEDAQRDSAEDEAFDASAI